MAERKTRSGALRILAWATAGVIAIPVVAYLAVWAINWRDVPPSRDARQLQIWADARPSVLDVDNAYLDVLGFGAPLSDDARALGKKRRSWLEAHARRAEERAHTFEDFPTDDVSLKETLTPRQSAVLEACGKVDRRCVASLEANIGAFEDPASLHRVWLNRYRAMLDRRFWKEPLPVDSSAPFPAYSLPLDAQRLHLIQIWAAAGSGQTDVVREALDADLRFWRTVLASSDMLISKMIAATAVRRNFEWSALVLSRLSPDRIDDAMPAGLATPITIQERSLRRAYVGEWIFVQSTMRASLENPLQVPDPESGTWLQRAGRRLAAPFVKPQDTNNLQAFHLHAEIRASEDSYGALARRNGLPVFVTHKRGTLDRFYNPAGRILAEIAEPAYRGYRTRAADLEGMRRASVAAITLHAQRVAPADVERTLRAGPWRSPYGAAPLAWQAETRCVLFVGLTSGEQGRSCALY